MAGTANAEVLWWEVACPRMKNSKKAIMARRMSNQVVQAGGGEADSKDIGPDPRSSGKQFRCFQEGQAGSSLHYILQPH